MRVKLIRAEWVEVPKRFYVQELIGTFPSIEDLPQWIQERYAVLRLQDAAAESPLGEWSITRDAIGTETLWLYIVRLPDDPEWEK